MGALHEEDREDSPDERRQIFLEVERCVMKDCRGAINALNREQAPVVSLLNHSACVFRGPNARSLVLDFRVCPSFPLSFALSVPSVPTFALAHCHY